MKGKDKRRECVAKFACSRKHKMNLKMLLNYLLGGELAQFPSKSLMVPVDTMLLDVQANEPRKL
jgi:hypothetical protein